MAETLNIKSDGDIIFILISELPAREQAPFKQWLLIEGQTQPLIDKELDGNCAYPWDYELWKSNSNATHLL